LLEVIETDVIYKLNQTSPEQQIQEIAPCKSPPLDHHEERHFNVKLVKRPIANDNHNKEKMDTVDLSHRRKKVLYS